jgi:K+-transporting ATPase ATPase A chain
MKMTALAILVTLRWCCSAPLAMMTEAGRSGMFNPGIHGFSEVLYAVSSAANNNGSAFAGLSAATPFWNCCWRSACSLVASASLCRSWRLPGRW